MSTDLRFDTASGDGAALPGTGREQLREAELPWYREDHGEVGTLPGQIIGDPRHRFVPIRANRSSYVSGEAWQTGFTWPEIMAGAAASTWTDRDGSPWDGANLGVRLNRSGLVVVDADVVLLGYGETGVQGCEVHHGPAGIALYADGRSELLAALRALRLNLPRSLTLKSAGRPDGSHLPGRHIYYRQNPDHPVCRDGVLAPHVEIKATVLARVTNEFELLVDAPIAVLPGEVARAIQPARLTWSGHGSEYGSPARTERGALTGGTLAEVGESYVARVLEQIAESNQVGRWNSAVYWGVRELFGIGVEGGEVLALVMEAAAPWDDQQRRVVEGIVSRVQGGATAR